MWSVALVIICIINAQVTSGRGTAGCQSSGANQCKNYLTSGTYVGCSNTIYPSGKNTSPAPIDLTTERAIFQKTSKNLTFSFIKNEKYTITNDGSTIRITPPNTLYSTFNITGGVLGDCVYYFVEARLFWNPSKIGGSSYIIDATTFTISFQPVFCKNRKNIYSNDNQCVVLGNPVEVEGTYPNPRFVNFGNALKKVVKAGSSTQLKLTDILGWTNVTASNFYYAYNGSLYMFNQNNTQVYSRTIFVSFPKFLTRWISNCQFVYFQNLRNYKNTFLAPMQPSYRQAELSTTIYQFFGVSEKQVY